MAQLYPLLRELHDLLGRASLGVALVMLGVAVYIGLIRNRDVTLVFRRATYAVVGLMVAESAVGGLMYLFADARPAEGIHLIYGLGAMLALPFFIFVEVTARKRPAMSSYVWGFSLLAGVVLRSIMTGGQ